MNALVFESQGQSSPLDPRRNFRDYKFALSSFHAILRRESVPERRNTRRSAWLVASVDTAREYLVRLTRTLCRGKSSLPIYLRTRTRVSRPTRRKGPKERDPFAWSSIVDGEDPRIEGGSWGMESRSRLDNDPSIPWPPSFLRCPFYFTGVLRARSWRIDNGYGAITRLIWYRQ